MPNQVAELRLICPPRQLAAWEARTVAERQAHRFHHLVAVAEPPFPEQAIEFLPRLTVRYSKARRLAGALRWTGGEWCIVVNSGDTWGRQRFSLAHELKHLLDHPFQRTIYRDGRFGSAHWQAERAADYFAACLLMPKAWVKRLFYDEGLRDEFVLARRFQVSVQAMRYRLDQLGLYEPMGVAA
ncbi:MAG TPA: ImmA/IrrE family metallo-endopeptidase [Thermoleophilaceae bacterium]|jgi:predicted transcriptional regulator